MASESSIDRVAAARELLHSIARDHPPAVFACSFGAEDMVLRRPDRARRAADRRLHARHRPAARRDARADRSRPRALRDRRRRLLSRARGDPGARRSATASTRFYRSVELRKACCDMRKVEPLGRALAGKRAWITGLRREQSRDARDVPCPKSRRRRPRHRQVQPARRLDAGRRLALHPQHDVPYNALHDRVYPSIGCAPCTRAIAVGEDFRAGPLVVGAGGAPRNADCIVAAQSAPYRRSRMNAPMPLRPAAAPMLDPPSRLARRRSDPHPARSRRPVRAARRCCSPAARIRWCCCASPRRRSSRARSALPVPAAARRHRPQLSGSDRLPRPARGRARRAPDRRAPSRIRSQRGTCVCARRDRKRATRTKR